MTLEEFRTAYLEAQNGLGNDLQTLISLSRSLSDLASRITDRLESVQTSYIKMNEAVEQFINEQDSQG
jgi:hypothetical protein